MTEQQWLVCQDPSTMFQYLKRRKVKRMTNREVRLFLVACGRRIWHLLEDERSRIAIEVVDRLGT